MTRESVNQKKIELAEAIERERALRIALTKEQGRVAQLKKEIDESERAWFVASGRVKECKPAGFPRQPRVASKKLSQEEWNELQNNPIFQMLSDAKKEKVMAQLSR